MKISKLLPSLALVTAVIAASSCGKLEDRINSLEQRISELENTRIPSIDEQVASIKRPSGNLKRPTRGFGNTSPRSKRNKRHLKLNSGKPMLL